MKKKKCGVSSLNGWIKWNFFLRGMKGWKLPFPSIRNTFFYIITVETIRMQYLSSYTLFFRNLHRISTWLKGPKIAYLSFFCWTCKFTVKYDLKEFSSFCDPHRCGSFLIFWHYCMAIIWFDFMWFICCSAESLWYVLENRLIIYINQKKHTLINICVFCVKNCLSSIHFNNPRLFVSHSASIWYSRWLGEVKSVLLTF